ncbi:hypothetical protein C8R45DRAFT_928781 [Mycena sanguinolenta]|nr:hypothetical protein C8R45DRAFT_928781 [Mycena sanguinolenta]
MTVALSSDVRGGQATATRGVGGGENQWMRDIEIYKYKQIEWCPCASDGGVGGAAFDSDLHSPTENQRPRGWNQMRATDLVPPSAKHRFDAQCNVENCTYHLRSRSDVSVSRSMVNDSAPLQVSSAADEIEAVSDSESSVGGVGGGRRRHLSRDREPAVPGTRWAENVVEVCADLISNQLDLRHFQRPIASGDLKNGYVGYDSDAEAVMEAYDAAVDVYISDL